jgi:predicted adenine nucleotide alpha hydrolase (AANH) superfamily ATPase
MLVLKRIDRVEPVPTVHSALRELEREYATRERIFARMVKDGAMRPERAAFRQACLDMALEALRVRGQV